MRRPDHAHSNHSARGIARKDGEHRCRDGVDVGGAANSCCRVPGLAVANHTSAPRTVAHSDGDARDSML
jgi:hypothetical protein